MKAVALILFVFLLAAGSYIARKQSNNDAQVMIEDSVGSSMAAPIQL